jgi:hypothetical protein
MLPSGSEPGAELCSTVTYRPNQRGAYRKCKVVNILHVKPFEVSFSRQDHSTQLLGLTFVDTLYVSFAMYKEVFRQNLINLARAEQNEGHTSVGMTPVGVVSSDANTLE